MPFRAMPSTCCGQVTLHNLVRDRAQTMLVGPGVIHNFVDSGAVAEPHGASGGRQEKPLQIADFRELTAVGRTPLESTGRA